jgi:hypothetical protein
MSQAPAARICTDSLRVFRRAARSFSPSAMNFRLTPTYFGRILHRNEHPVKMNIKKNAEQQTGTRGCNPLFSPEMIVVRCFSPSKPGAANATHHHRAGRL